MEPITTIEKASDTEINIIVQAPQPAPEVQKVSLESLVALSEQYKNDIAFIKNQKAIVDAQIAEARNLGVIEVAPTPEA